MNSESVKDPYTLMMVLNESFFANYERSENRNLFFREAKERLVDILESDAVKKNFSFVFTGSTRYHTVGKDYLDAWEKHHADMSSQ